MAFGSRQRRVLYVLQGLPVPFDRRAWLHATALAAHGYAVSFICPKGRGFDLSREEREGVDIYRYWRPIEGEGKLAFIGESLWCFFATLLLSLRVALFGRGFDILHVCNPPEIYWPIAWFWRAFGKVFIWDHRDLSPELAAAKFGAGDGPIMSLLFLLERLSFRAAQIVVATNESYKRIAVERGNKRAEDVFIVRSAPSLSKFKIYQPDPSFKQGKRHLILYLGEMGPQDGVDNLVRAVKVLRDDLGRSDFHCVLIGGGTYQPAVAALAGELGVADLCTFTGVVSDEMLCRILSSGDVAVEDPDHPATRHLGASWRWHDEVYQFRDLRPDARVLLRVPPAQLDLTASGAKQPSFGFPLSWCFTEANGRVFSTSLGHFPAAWESPAYLRHLAGGLGWAVGAVE